MQFSSIRKLARILVGAAITVPLGAAPAAAVTTTGIAVASTSAGDTTQVGVTADRTGTLGGIAIKYFIPLEPATSGTYGTGGSCSGSGVGTCSDVGNGVGTLWMNLYFSPVSMTGVSTLSVLFEDLDLIGANDPNGFLEQVRVLDGNSVPLTPWITDIAGLVTNGSISGDHNTQLLTLSLGQLTHSPLYLILKFKSYPTFTGKNTPEYLIATVSGPDAGTSPVPLPPALVLLGTALVGLGALRRRRTGSAGLENATGAGPAAATAS